MSMHNIAVKTTAKSLLKNNYTSGIIAGCIPVFAFFVCLFCAEMINTVFGAVGTYISFFVLFVLLIAPLITGYVYYSTRFIFTGESQPVLIFKYFSSKAYYIKALTLSFIITGNAFLFGTLFFLPAIFTDLLASGKLFTLLNMQIPLWASSLWAVSSVLKFLAFIFTVLFMLKYYIAPFLMAADENMDPLEAVHMSKIISLRSKKDFVWLVLSFSGYIVLCLFFIPIIFVLPYFNTSYSVHCRFAVAAYNNTVDKLNQPSIPSFNADISF